MGNKNQLSITEISEMEVSDIVALFNKNAVYQFSDKMPLTLEDFKLTMAVKEVSHFYVLKSDDKIIGTTAFFKFTVHDCLKDTSSYSGFLLIDSLYRSGTAISFLYKEVLFTIMQLNFFTLYTEISKYNKASLSLGKLNGFTKYNDSYEDIVHCISLRSVLPKIFKAFRTSDYYGKDYDLTTFKIIEEKELTETNLSASVIRTEISNEIIEYSVQQQACFPYSIKMDLFSLQLIQKDGGYQIKAEFFSTKVLKIVIKISPLKVVILKPDRAEYWFHRFKSVPEQVVKAKIKTVDGDILIQLACADSGRNNSYVHLNKRFNGYNFIVSPDGGLQFQKNNVTLMEDSFLIFSKSTKGNFSVVEEENKVIITYKQNKMTIKKTIEFSKTTLMINYYFHRIDKSTLPQYLKQGFRFYNQNYLIKDTDSMYKPYLPGVFPIEHDDFLKASTFSSKVFHYLLPEYKQEITYAAPSELAGNQMQYRPLSLLDKDQLNDFSYQIHFTNVPEEASKYKRAISEELYEVELQDEVKKLTNFLVFSEVGFGTKRMSSAIKKIESSVIDIAYPYIFIDRKKHNLFYEYLSVSFDYKLNRHTTQVIYGNKYRHENKSFIIERVNELILFDEKEETFLVFEAKNGRFYSYKENNLLKIRCVFKKERDLVDTICIKKYRSGKRKYDDKRI